MTIQEILSTERKLYLYIFSAETVNITYITFLCAWHYGLSYSHYSSLDLGLLTTETTITTYNYAHINNTAYILAVTHINLIGSLM